MMSEGREPPLRLQYSRSRFLRRGAFAAGVRMSGLLCVFALQVLLARLIADATQYGQYAWGQSLLFLAANVACVGVPLVASRFGPPPGTGVFSRSPVTVTRPVPEAERPSWERLPPAQETGAVASGRSGLCCVPVRRSTKPW